MNRAALTVMFGLGVGIALALRMVSAGLLLAHLLGVAS
jgi:hypothetical protein